jgi:hypothetical protein
VVSAQPSGEWAGGTGVPKARDSAAITVGGTADGTNALAGFNLPGDSSKVASSVVGATSVPVGTSTWRTQSYWDTTMYVFDWYVDGSEVSAGTHASVSHSFPVAGLHTLRSVTVLGTGTTDTVTFTATVGAVATASGPSTISSTAPVTYTATATGCNAARASRCEPRPQALRPLRAQCLRAAQGGRRRGTAHRASPRCANKQREKCLRICPAQKLPLSAGVA